MFELLRYPKHKFMVIFVAMKAYIGGSSKFWSIELMLMRAFSAIPRKERVGAIFALASQIIIMCS